MNGAEAAAEPAGPSGAAAEMVAGAELAALRARVRDLEAQLKASGVAPNHGVAPNPKNTSASFEPITTPTGATIRYAQLRDLLPSFCEEHQ